MSTPIVITTPRTGGIQTGKASTVLIGGREITGIFSIEMSISVNDISKLTIKRYPRKGEEIIGQLENEPDSLVTETIAFQGRLAFEGELIAGYWVRGGV